MPLNQNSCCIRMHKILFEHYIWMQLNFYSKSAKIHKKFQHRTVGHSAEYHRRNLFQSTISLNEVPAQNGLLGLKLHGNSCDTSELGGMRAPKPRTGYIWSLQMNKTMHFLENIFLDIIESCRPKKANVTKMLLCILNCNTTSIRSRCQTLKAWKPMQNLDPGPYPVTNFYVENNGGNTISIFLWNLSTIYQILFSNKPQVCHEIPSAKLKDNSRIFQGSFRNFQGCSNWVQVMWKCSVTVQIWRISMQCIALSAKIQGFQGSFSKMKDFSRILQNFH